jgi:putative endonuclease
MTDPRHDLGYRAEEAAARWLTGIGWTVVARRWRAPTGELDLVCVDPDGALVGVEVKLRRTGRAGSGADGLDARRLHRLRATLGSWAAGSGARYPAIRLDLVTLTPAAQGSWRIGRIAAIDRW